jgi:hypothetical protein
MIVALAGTAEKRLPEDPLDRDVAVAKRLRLACAPVPTRDVRESANRATPASEPSDQQTALIASFPPPRFAPEILDYGHDPRSRLHVVKKMVLKFKDKFEDTDDFDKLEMHESRLYEGCRGDELRDVIYLLLDDKCLEGVTRSLMGRYREADTSVLESESSFNMAPVACNLCLRGWADFDSLFYPFSIFRRNTYFTKP